MAPPLAPFSERAAKPAAFGKGKASRSMARWELLETRRGAGIGGRGFGGGGEGPGFKKP